MKTVWKKNEDGDDDVDKKVNTVPIQGGYVPVNNHLNIMRSSSNSTCCGCNSTNEISKEEITPNRGRSGRDIAINFPLEVILRRPREGAG